MGYYNRLPGTNQYDNGGTACGKTARGAAGFPERADAGKKQMGWGRGGHPGGGEARAGWAALPGGAAGADAASGSAAAAGRSARAGAACPGRISRSAGPAVFAAAIQAASGTVRQASSACMARCAVRRAFWRRMVRACPAQCSTVPAGGCRVEDAGRRPRPASRQQAASAAEQTTTTGCRETFIRMPPFPGRVHGVGKDRTQRVCRKKRAAYGRARAAGGSRAGENSAGSGEGAAALRPGDGGRPEHETA